MSEKSQDTRIIERYTDQPTRMPIELRRRIEARWAGKPVQLYAMADLNESLSLSERWFAIGPSHAAVAGRRDDGSWRIDSFERRDIEAVRELPGLSSTSLVVLGTPGEPPLASLRYTHRQRRAMENVRFVLEEHIEGRQPAPSDADLEYERAIAGPVREAQALVGGTPRAVLWRLLGYLRPYRRRMLAGFAAAMTITGVSLVPPYLAGYLIDDVVRPIREGSLPLSQGLRTAWAAVILMAAAYLVRQVAAHVRLRQMSVLGEFVARDLRTELYEHLQRLSLSFYSRKKTGGLITRVSSDTDRLWEFLAFGIVDVSLSAVMLVGLSTVLLSLDWRLGLVMILPVPLLCWSIFRHGERIHRLFARAWRKWSGLTDILSDTIPGMRVVKAFNQEEREKRRFDASNDAAMGEFNRIHRVWTFFWPTLMLGVHAMTMAVWALAVPRLLGTADGSDSLTAGTFVSFLLYMTMYVQPIEVIGQMARVMNRATSSAHRVFEVLDTEPEVRDVARPRRLERMRGAVAFESVTFGYDGVKQVLKWISFSVAQGEMIGLVGPSGGGKTTVTNLIARFYDPTGGRILVDGIDLRTLEAGHYRRQLGIVLQDPYLFHGSILENIRYGHPDASLDSVVQAARAANAHDFVCRLPMGYETVVGERGQTLSGGERQRVSIARAILHDPKILILDEATSAVDTETERKIQEAIDRLVSGRTVFAIAHRLSTLARADRIFVMKSGHLVEAGTQTDLLALENGVYRRLYELQRQPLKGGMT
ncbi:MAG: ABC transporter ATP-binding protein [Gemmatimonadetes bacterium]|nr:ABC transporter ATP-binding protein [Gemmatimonadota bacterium]MYC91937.1 ABC transporter ATP-binding protein [Gemmatimonadota bacterium]MYJ17399.1 ABC transporter ATP-binding protein [Gemmatimonadota bacterium]